MGKLGFVGYGVVGSALEKAFGRYYETKINDPAKGYLNDLRDCGVVFVCIHTDNMNEVEAVVREHEDANLIIIKTTVRPGTTDNLIEQYGHHIVFVPEFLSEDSAEEDAKKPDKIIIGTKYYDIASAVVDLYKPFNAPHVIMQPIEAEITKLAINTFFAVKVSFANEIYDLCREHNASYDIVKLGMMYDKYINPNHLDVFHKGYRGYGGKCLPKDVNMLLRSAIDEGNVPMVVSAAKRENDLRRNGDL